MSTLQVSITDQDLRKFGLSRATITFEELLEKINTELARQALYACQDIAQKIGLSNMTLAEINAEIASVRQKNG